MLKRFFQTYLPGSLRYRGGGAQWSYLFHRITGIGTLTFLFIHILDTSTVYFFPELYVEAIAIYRTTGFILGEIILVFFVLFHGVNGLRIALSDLFPRYWETRFRNRSLRGVFILSIVLWIPAAIIMSRNLIEHNFSGG